MGATRNGLSVEKLEKLSTYSKDEVYTSRERLALSLAERMTYTSRRVTNRFFGQLRKEFSEEELVELAAVIALENFRSKFNPVFGVESNGLCEIPSIQEAVNDATARFK